jgi:REP element-mobilizing transposase RayT
VTFKPHHDPTHLYFVTATIMGWRHLFIEPVYAHIVLDSLDWHQRNGRWSLFAFVVMPNHTHVVIRPLGDQTISMVLQSFGSYTAHTILDLLQEDRKTDLLRFFAQRQDRDASKQHQVWLPIEAKNVYSAEFLQQKVEYTHNNPVAKHWHLVDDRADYPYSSACFYDRGEEPIIAVADVRKWMQ